MEVADTFEFLLGTWTLLRVLEDHRSGARGRLDATAALVASGAGRAVYEETGVLRLDAYRAPATRRLDYVRGPRGALTVRFVDGRRFVDLDLGTGRWKSVHLCGSDRYEITTTVRSEHVVEERWRVRGPDKRYDALTTFTRTTRCGGSLAGVGN